MGGNEPFWFAKIDGGVVVLSYETAIHCSI